MVPMAPATQTIPGAAGGAAAAGAAGGIAGTAGASGAPGAVVADPGAQPQVQTISTGSDPASRRRNTTFGIEAIFTLSDNLLRSGPGLEKSGRVIELSPYMLGNFASERLTADYAVRARGLYYNTNGVSDGNVSPDVRGTADLDIAGDALKLSGTANVLRIADSPFGAAQVDPGLGLTGTRLFRGFELSPYSQGRIGNGVDYGLRYRARWIDPGEPNPKSTANEISGKLASSRGSSSLLGWSATGDFKRIAIEGGSEFNITKNELLAYLNPSSRVRFGAGVYFAKVDVLTIDGRNSSYGPAATFDWRIGPNSSFSASLADTYYGTESTVRLAHRSGSWNAAVAYSRGLRGANETGLLVLNPGELFAVSGQRSREVDSVSDALSRRRLLVGAGQPLTVGLIDADLAYVDSVIAALGVVRGRNAVLLTVFVNNQRSFGENFLSGALTRLEQNGVLLSLDHQLDARDSLFLEGSYLISKAPLTEQEARLLTVLTGWRSRLTQRLSAQAALRYAQQRSAGTGLIGEFDERALILSLDYRF